MQFVNVPCFAVCAVDIQRSKATDFRNNHKRRRFMSASDYRELSDYKLLDSFCETLEAKLSKKVCASLQKAIDDTVCASLKRGIHEAVQPLEHREAQDKGDTFWHEVSPSLEEVTGNAVCAALKQVVADTVCNALQETISTSVRNAAKWQRDVPFHVTPDALNISLEEVTGNAVCAALKQVVADTVCKPLNKAIAESTEFVFRTYKRQTPPSLSEQVRADTEIASAEQLELGADYVWRAPEKDKEDELCAAVQKKIAKEVCSRLQQLAASTLCAMLKKAIRQGIREHAECREDSGLKRSVERGASKSVLTAKNGLMVVAFIAAAAVAIATLVPGLPSLWPTASATTLTLVPSSTNIDAAGNVQLSGVLSKGGNGVGGQTISLERLSGDAWTVIASVTTRSDGSFSFALTRENLLGVETAADKNHVYSFTSSATSASEGTLINVGTGSSNPDTLVVTSFTQNTHEQADVTFTIEAGTTNADRKFTPRQGIDIELQVGGQWAGYGITGPDGTASIAYHFAAPGPIIVQVTLSASNYTPTTGFYNASYSPVIMSPTPTKTARPSTVSISPGPSGEPQPQGQPNATVVIPRDLSPSPNGHYYRVVFSGSTQLAASTSASILINDNYVNQNATFSTPLAAVIERGRLV
jgi:hypothetical protein